MANIKEAFEYASQNPNSDFAKNLESLAKSGALNTEAKKYNIDLSSFQEIKQEEPQGETGLKGIGVGIAKGALSTIKGIGQLGEKILPPAKAYGSAWSEEALAKGKGAGKLFSEQTLTPKSTEEKIGKFGEQVAEFALPAGKVSKLTEGANLATKIATRAATSGAVATTQQGELGKGTAIAAGTEVVLPIVGKVLKPVANIMGRLIKGLGSGLSGVGTQTLEQITKNPKMARQISSQIKTEGGSKILKDEANKIIEGVSGIKKEAREAYGTALQELKATDIQPKTFRGYTQELFDKYGVYTEGNNRILSSVEFENPTNINKASKIFDKISNTNLDGKSLKNTIDYIDNQKYKIATGDERLSFNAFVKDTVNTLKDAINNSTDKLSEMNKAYTQDMQLAEAIENIFGKVRFKNSTEILKVSKQLENLFGKKGLSQDYIDDFLKRAGIKGEEFKTGEAVRQIMTKETGANTKGLSIGEIMQQITSSVITPNMVKNIAILTGKTEPVIKKLLEKTAPSARGALIKSLLPNNQK